MLHEHLIPVTSPIACPENIVVFGNKRITVLTPCLFRLEENDNRDFCDDATQVVWFRNHSPIDFQVDFQQNQVIIHTSEVTFLCHEDIRKSCIIFPDGKTVPLTNNDNLLGTYRTLDCCDGDFYIPYDGKRSQGKRIQLENGIVSRSGVAVYDDSNSLILKQDGTLEPRKNNSTDIYIFAYGTNYRKALQGLYQICGSTPHIPRYALGNWWSRYHAYTEKEYLDKMDTFADSDIPFTVATVDMDWHWSESMPEGVDGWTGYSWNTNLFPDYQRFLSQLHNRNMHVTLNLHPADGVRPFEDMYEEMAEQMGYNPEEHIDIPFDITNETFINAYFDVLHKPYEKKGVDFWWIDWQQGQRSSMIGLDPLWALNHYHYLDISKEKEALILSRYAGIGSHRYPIGFSGDTYVTWDTLNYLPYFTSTATNCGYTWWSHDIGGHMGGEKDNELYVRFIQFGVFSPINRLHSTKSPTFLKEPFSYQNGSGLIAKEFLKLRHAMIPFLYSASCKTAEQGVALIEPMYYEYPTEQSAYECPGQYLFGGQFIAAPVTKKSTLYGMVTNNVWIPEGRWTDFFTGDVYHGGKWKSITRYLDSFPLLAKEGAFFLLDGNPSGNKVSLPKVLKVVVFQGSGSYQLYEDNNAKRAITEFRSNQISNQVQKVNITISDEYEILPSRDLLIEFRNVLKGQVTISVNGNTLPCQVRYSEYTTVLIPNICVNKSYEITISETADEQTKRNVAIQRILTEFEWTNSEKDTLYEKLSVANTLEQYKKTVEESVLPDIFKLRLLEIEF